MPRLSSLITRGLTAPYVTPAYWHIPAGAVIIYGGSTDPGLTGWTRYSAADGYFIKGTTTQAEIGVTYAGNNASLVQTQSTTTGTNGAHYTQSQFIANTYYNGTGNRTAYGSGGNHNHTLTFTLGAGTDLNPNSSDLVLLQATVDQKYLPQNTWVPSPTQHTNGTQITATTDVRYIRGTATKTDTTATARDFTGSTNLQGTHVHGNYNETNAGPQTSPVGTGAWTGGNPVYLDSNTQNQNHVHSVATTISTSRLTGKLFKLWQLAQKSIPDDSIVLMYTGTISSLPYYWKVCDGTLGTPNMVNYFLGYSNLSATAHDTATAYAMSMIGGSTLSTHNWSHSHNSNLYYQYCWPVPYAHASAYFAHTHTITSPTQTTFQPAEIKVCFIQLKKT